MCTAITYQTKDHYFGRNLDLEYSYNETVTVTPRNYPLHFRKAPSLLTHHAMIGMAFVVEDYPLYYDAVNEKGLAIAGLNFPGNATYYEEAGGKDNITPFELIPWLLGQCATIAEVKALLAKINILNLCYSEKLPLSPLHWIIADKESSITLETTADGMHIYDNPVGVLTNNPTFDFMMHYLSNYRDLSPNPSVNRFSDKVDLPTYCCGMAAIGLPGDYSSASRFVKATFTKLNSISEEDEAKSVGQFFHLLGSVEMPRGAVCLKEHVYDITVYSCCCNQDTGVYYYITYDNRQINAVDIKKENLDGTRLSSYTLNSTQNICLQN